jgi:hypothetical protein
MKKIYALSIAIGLVLTSIAQTPNYQWAKGAGSTDVDNALDNCTDANGNLYVVGYFKGFNINFGTGLLINSASTAEEAYIVKYDSLGTALWARSFGSVTNERATGVRTDALGNVYVTGNFSSASVVIGTFTLTNSTGFNHAFIVKYNPLGTVVWAKSVSSSNSSDLTSVGIATDASGNSYVTGATSTSSVPIGTLTINNPGYYLAKFNALGNVVWATQVVTGTQPVSNGLALDGSGNLYVTGNYVGPSTTFGSTTLSNASTTTNDVFLTKYDCNNGNVIWAVSGNGTGDDVATCVTVDNAGFAVVGGSFGGTSLTFGGTTATNVTTGSQDAFIARYNSAGTGVMLASNNNGLFNDRIQKLTTDVTGKIYASGYTYSTMFGFSGAPSFINSSSNSTSDAFIVKYDPATSGKWLLQIWSGNFNDFAWCITSSPGGNIYVAGSFEGSPVTIGTTTINNVASGMRDIFVAKIYNCLSAPAQPSTILGNTVTCIGNSLTYSIPSMVGVTGYTWTTPAGWSGSSSTNILNTSSGISGNIGITLQNACGVSTIKNLSVTVNPQPTVTVNSGSICAGNSFTMMPSGASTYTFSSGSAVVTPVTTSAYFVTGTTVDGCITPSVAVSNVTVIPQPTITAISSNTLLCSGQSATLSASGGSIYLWNPGGSGPSITISPTVSTNYSVTGTDANGCTNLIVITQSVSACTGIKTNTLGSLSGIEVYPNPTNGLLTIITNGEKQTGQVYNLLGEMVLTIEVRTTNSELDFSSQPNGIYFVRIGSVTKKIVKQ